MTEEKGQSFLSGSTLGAVFIPEPESWGYRGDPYVWREMRRVLKSEVIPATDDEAEHLFRSTFEAVVQVDLSNPDQEMEVEREEFAHGGMSSGMIDLRLWKRTLLPLLVARARIARGDEPLMPSTPS